MLIKAVQDYYDKLGIHYEESDILITTGGSEALQMLMLSILDNGSEVIIPEPFYPNYNTFIKSAGGTIRPLTTSPEAVIAMLSAKSSRLLSTKTPAQSCSPTQATPPALF